MKKQLIFAFAALALAFTACESNGPKNPDEINIKDYVGSMWFLDSVNVGDFTTTHMCQPIFLLSETSIQLGNEVCPFRFENGKLYITQSGKDSDTVESQYIHNVQDGSLIGYKYFDLSTSSKAILKVKGKFNGDVSVRFAENGKNEYISRLELNGEKEIEIKFNSRSQKEALYFYFEGKGKFDFYTLQLD